MVPVLLRCLVIGLVAIAYASAMPQAFPANENAAPTEQPQVSARSSPKDTAHLAVRYRNFRVVGKEIVESYDPRPVLIVTTRYGILLSDVRSQAAFSLLDLDGGDRPIKLELVDIGGQSWITTDKEHDAYKWFVFTAAPGEEIHTDRRYSLTIHYERVASWNKPSEDGANGTAPSRVDQPEAPVTITLVPTLELGKEINNNGEVVVSKTPQSNVAPTDRKGLSGLLDDIEIELTPQAAEGSDELALTYKLGYQIDRQRFGGSNPGSFTLDLAIDGREATDDSDPTLTGYSRGDLSARAMFLLGKDRYYPVGARLAAGYESGDDTDDAGATITGQLVGTVPYIDGLLESWQQTMEFERAFAPPFLSLAYVSSDAEVASDDQDRFELEAGWIMPIASEWDLNLRWRHYNFTEKGVDTEELTEIDLTYFAGGDLTQGVRISFEDGYRAAVGDIGSRFLLGYTARL